MATIAILGAGNVGQALAVRCRESGFDACIGARDPKPIAGVDVPVLPPAEATRVAEFVMLAVPAEAAVDALKAAGGPAGQIVVDCTNPLLWRDGPMWAPPSAGSTSRVLAAAFPRAAIVKGFNHFGLEIMRNPRLADGPADAFFASDDAEAKRRTMALATRMGFRAVDAGPLRNAAVLENLAVLWIHLALNGGLGRNFAFRIAGR